MATTLMKMMLGLRDERIAPSDRTLRQSEKNPLFEITLPIPWNLIQAEHVKPAVDHHLALADHRMGLLERLIAAGPAPAYADIATGIEEACAGLAYVNNVARFLLLYGDRGTLFGIASRYAREKATMFFDRVLSDGAIYRSLLASAPSSPLEKHHLAILRMAFLLRGAPFEDEAGIAKRERLEQIDVELAKLEASLRNDDKAFCELGAVHVYDASRLGGISEKAIEQAKRDAADHEETGFRFPAHEAQAGALLHADDASLREAMWRAWYSRRVSRPLIEAILQLRNEKARLLGFEHWADVANATCATLSAEGARAFIDSVANDEEQTSGCARQIARVWEYAKRHSQDGHENGLPIQQQPDGLGEESVSPFRQWDFHYFHTRMRNDERNAKYKGEEDLSKALAPYFTRARFIEALFRLARDLYGIRFDRDDDAPVWAGDVRAFQVIEEERLGSNASPSRSLGMLYLDLFRSKGSWSHELIAFGNRTQDSSLRSSIAFTHDSSLRSSIIETPNNNEERSASPRAVVIRAGLDPKQPLDTNDILTLLGVFGNVLHRFDLRVVTPSQLHRSLRVFSDQDNLAGALMTTFAVQREVIDRLARHAETDAVLSDDLLARLRRTHFAYRPTDVAWGIAHARLELALHGNEHIAANAAKGAHAEDVITYASRLYAELDPIPPLPSDFTPATGLVDAALSPFLWQRDLREHAWSTRLDAALQKLQKNGKRLVNRYMGDHLRRSLFEPLGSKRFSFEG